MHLWILQMQQVNYGFIYFLVNGWVLVLNYFKVQILDLNPFQTCCFINFCYG